MARESVEQLRSAIVADTDELRTLKARRDELRRQASEVGRKFRTVETRRARRIKRARAAGATAEQLAADAGLTPGRIRQLAPTRSAKAGPGAAAVDEQLVADEAPGVFARSAEQRARVEQLAAGDYPTPKIEPGQLSGIARAVHELTSRTSSVNLPYDDEQLVDEILGDDDELDDDERQAPRVDVLGAIRAAVEGDQSSPAAAVVTYVKREQLAERGFPREGEHVEQLAAPARGKTPAGSRPRRGELDASRGIAGIFERSRRALETHGGDVAAAVAELVADAVPDAMRLLDASRAGATYDFTAHPSVPAPLKRPSRKAADMIWEGRPRYVNPSIPPGAEIDALDVNGAYLAALTRTHLPIGRLVEDRPGTPFDRRRSGIYLIEPIRWNHKGMPNPLGDGREERGPVWISGATMRLLIRAERLGFGTAPVILESHTSGSSENLLTKFGMILGEARRDAITAGDDVTLEYVKAMYSKFVSTAGDSRANHDLFRPEWVHEIRSQAYANLWYKAAKVRAAGVPIARMSGTDELHIAATWRSALDGKGEPLFRLGRGLAEMKIKTTYTTGGDRA